MEITEKSKTNSIFRERSTRTNLGILTGIYFTILLSTVQVCCLAQEVSFKKHTLVSDFVSEGIAVGDVNQDGALDMLAGPYWFEAPSWKRHELAEVQEFSVRKGYSNSMLNFTLDVNLDGWVDLIRIDFPGTGGYWHENPQGQEGHWKVHDIYDSVGNESPQLVDIDGDGREDLLFGDPTDNQVVWMRAPVKKGETEWERFVIGKTASEDEIIYGHGLGIGDINQDGRNDVLVKQGWWEGPADPMQQNWIFHPADFGEDCAQMYAINIDEDGDQDVLSSSAHYSGFWWYEQQPDGQNNPQWVRHTITQSMAETHALAVADINRDNRPDFVTGNRYFAHNSEDPRDHGPAVLYWFEYAPDKKPNPKWTGYPIDVDSGVGINIVAQDVTEDGLVDILVANKKGIFLFEQENAVANEVNE